MEYYFSEDPTALLDPPDWSLDQLFAWLHGVLHYVVLEEHNRTSTRREATTGRIGSESEDHRSLDPADPAPDQLDVLIQRELQEIVLVCFPMLQRKYRTVLKMRADGLKYGEIAVRLGVKENTVATLVSHGIRELARRVSHRTQSFAGRPGRPEPGSPHD
jgi:RNA polymerase sigma factor (sigma-70 family)